MDQIVYLILGASVTLGSISLLVVNNALKGNQNRGRH